MGYTVGALSLHSSEFEVLLVNELVSGSDLEGEHLLRVKESVTSKFEKLLVRNRWVLRY